MAKPMTPPAMLAWILEMQGRADTIKGDGPRKMAAGILDALAGQLLLSWPATPADASAIAAMLAEQRGPRADGADAVARAVLPFALKRMSEAP